jgi:dTDP-4-amino-4,6-dideoxygalactose transaminase
MFSFHATKPYHAIEGGMLTYGDEALKATLHYLRNFGIADEVTVMMPGTNAKMNEFQALMGILLLRHLDVIISRRRELSACYAMHLVDVPGLQLPPALPPSVRYNYAYYPIQVLPGVFPINRDTLYERLKAYNVFCRRYFYPLLTDLPCYQSLQGDDPLAVARRTAAQVLCLPLHHDLTQDDVARICAIVRACASEAAC